jgi:hypothetical protein
MKVLSPLIALTALTKPDVTSGFSNPSTTRRVNTACSAAVNRRDFISTAIATSVAVGGFSTFPSVSLADVSDGNSLPQGAAQFSRVIKVRAQLKVSSGLFQCVCLLKDDNESSTWMTHHMTPYVT